MTEDWNLAEVIQQAKDNERFTVLGLLGPAGSGKDEVADWLCKNKGFVKVSFADPIKRFTSRCFGIDWDRLWGPSEKRNEIFDVDDQWWRSAAEKMKDAASEITQEVLDVGVKVEGFLRMYDWLKNLKIAYPEKISARFVLQTLGTEWGRSVDEMMWARYAHKVAQKIKGDGKTSGMRYDPKIGLYPDECNAVGVVIPDHRFKNEVDLTRHLGGYALRLRRLELEKKNETVGISGHRSEAEQKTLPDEAFNLVLEFPEGLEKVHAMLEYAFKEKLWTRPNPTKLQDLQVVPS